MVKLTALLLIGCAVSFGNAQTAPVCPTDQLQKGVAQAKSLYNKHEYQNAAVSIQKLVDNSEITRLPDWPNALYLLARYQSRAGKSAEAISNLRAAVNSSVKPISVEHIQQEADFNSLHEDVEFLKLISELKNRETIWKDGPAIATPYKPGLTEDEKIAGLSKFWSEARYNFAHFGQLQNFDWDRLYMAYLPQVRNAKNTADYYRILMRFAAELHDGHTGVFPPIELAAEFYARPKLRTELIENAVLITHVSDPVLEQQGIHPGLEILSIDGEPVHSYAEKHIAPYVSSSTPQDRNIRMYDFMLLAGAASEPITLSLRDQKENVFTRIIHRCVHNCDDRSEPVEFKILPSNIAYLAVNEFEDDRGAKTLLENFDEISHANAFIIDVRENGGGDSENGDAILKMLTAKPYHSSPWISLDYRPPYRTWFGFPGYHTDPPDTVSADGKHVFAKPVVLLIGPKTGSAAEDFVSSFQGMHRGILIGEPTAGSTGQPIFFKLPGGGSARICSIDEPNPDGSVFVGVGIIPQITISPTLADVRAGRDPILDRAVQEIKTQTRH